MARKGIAIVLLALVSGCFVDPAALSEGSSGDGSTGERDDTSGKPSDGTTGTPATSGTGGADASTSDPGDTSSSSESTEGEGSDSSSGTDSSSSGSSEGGEESSTGEPLDCAGEPGGDAQLDACGVCNGPGGPCLGCTVLSASNYDPLADINDGTCVCMTAGGGAADQSNLDSNAGAGSSDQWQSFTAGISGGLVQIDLGVSSPISGASDGTLRFYEGEGTAGTLLGTQQVVFEDVFNTMQEFVLDEPVAMIAGEVYTVRFSVPNVTVGWVDVGPNAYPGGRASFDPNRDFVFRTTMSQCIPE